MRCHFVPLDRRRATEWDLAAGGALATWGHGGLVTNLCTVAQRRLMEASRLALPDKPLIGAIGVGGEDIAAFLDGQPGFDDRVADLLAGLVWVRRPRQEERKRLYEIWKTHPGPLPLAYAALKPLFTPDAALKRLGIGLPENFALPIPPALPGLLAADRVDEGVRLGMTRARSLGFAVPFVAAKSVLRPGAGRRLLAALLIPVRRAILHDCIRRAYPVQEERSDAA
jgi:CRISPR-associated protein Csx17